MGIKDYHCLKILYPLLIFSKVFAANALEKLRKLQI